ncbi:DinB family protein [Taibaiella koreensis]|uniref:DinB family protein n=1 Tax=Taibaiella koreensis TaxID=1268548 RepID=UPI000E59F89E|nr:DinB family protein [Taibaiella koreensis]
MQPAENEYAPYYGRYIKMVTGDIMDELREQPASFTAFINGIPKEKGDYAYAPGKWTIKEVLGHLLDTERIMAYRALRIARMDDAPLPGFDEDAFVANAHFKDRDITSLLEELELIRRSNLFLFETFSEETLQRSGTASGHTVSVRALLYIIVGHLKHHRLILEERYL